MIKQKTLYVTNDGTEFNSLEEAERYESSFISEEDKYFNSFCKSYCGKELLKKYSLDSIGIWEIRGEDPNCDFGGYHHEPYLDTVNSTLEQAIRYAVKIPSWFTWVSGGSIKPVEVKKL